MRHWRRDIRPKGLIMLVLLGCLVSATAQVAAVSATATTPYSLQAAFASAAHEFGVPESVLLAVAYNQSRWEHHNGAPSTWGGYGPMHLTDIGSGTLGFGRGDGIDRAGRARPGTPALHTLTTAATLLGLSPETLKRDPVQNIRGGAALLAQYSRQATGTLPSDVADWYTAVTSYSGAEDRVTATSFADAVYRTMQEGVSRTTSDGQIVTLAAQDVVPNTDGVASLRLRDVTTAGADCPAELACLVVPAAYQQNNPDDPSDYGNYDVANRPSDGLDIDYIVIHNTEIPYDTTIALFQNPLAYVSSHYVIRASDGQTTQMVENKDVAWTAGNWYVNTHSINLEHEGIAIEGTAWYSEQMYQASARLTRYLADKYGIPLDRGHILGHDDVPGPIAAIQPEMHWDPGPYWDWAHYMALIGAPIDAPDENAHSSIVTINPSFATNQPPISYCFEDGCRDVPPQPASFVYLHTAPSFDAPLVDDPALPGPGTTRAVDWGDKAATGQQFYLVEKQGDWTAIYFSGQKAWFHNPGGMTNTIQGSGTLVTPKEGVEAIPVYGRAYPDPSAYPEGMLAQSIEPLQYTIPAGQIYVATDLVRGDYYWSPTQAERATIEGDTSYYLIFFSHRLVYVKASDVSVVWQPHRMVSVGTAEGETAP